MNIATQICINNAIATASAATAIATASAATAAALAADASDDENYDVDNDAEEIDAISFWMALVAILAIFVIIPAAIAGILILSI